MLLLTEDRPPDSHDDDFDNYRDTCHDNLTELLWKEDLIDTVTMGGSGQPLNMVKFFDDDDDDLEQELDFDNHDGGKEDLWSSPPAKVRSYSKWSQWPQKKPTLPYKVI